VNICTDGKIKLKPRKSVGEGFPLADRDTGPGKGGQKFHFQDKFQIINFRLYLVWYSVL
jgi:hypothetical protein